MGRDHEGLELRGTGEVESREGMRMFVVKSYLIKEMICKER